MEIIAHRKCDLKEAEENCLTNSFSSRSSKRAGVSETENSTGHISLWKVNGFRRKQI